MKVRQNGNTFLCRMTVQDDYMLEVAQEDKWKIVYDELLKNGFIGVCFYGNRSNPDSIVLYNQKTNNGYTFYPGNKFKKTFILEPREEATWAVEKKDIK